jgi:hypothetical protein
MLGKSLANSRPGLCRSLCAPGLVVSLTLRHELQEQQGLTLPLVCADVLVDDHRGVKLQIRSDHPAISE